MAWVSVGPESESISQSKGGITDRSGSTAALEVLTVIDSDCNDAKPSVSRAGSVAVVMDLSSRCLDCCSNIVPDVSDFCDIGI